MRLHFLQWRPFKRETHLGLFLHQFGYLVRFGLVAVLVLLVVLGDSIPTIRYMLQLNAAEVLHRR